MNSLLSRERIIAPPGYNRWRVPLASVAIHLCIGSVYAWSIYNPPLTRVLGVVTSAADDWNLGQVVWVFTVAIVFLGLAAAFAGKWLEKVGPRKVGVVAACCWGGGYIVGAAGILTHQLWLLYLGYGVIGGCGLGLGYVSPVSTLIRWFPDRRGMAAGMAIMGFGGGAMIGAPMKEFFLRLFYRAPEYLGAISDVDLVTQAGRRFVDIAGNLQEVVTVGAVEARGMTIPGPGGCVCRQHRGNRRCGNFPDHRRRLSPRDAGGCLFVSIAGPRLETCRMGRTAERRAPPAHIRE